LISLSFATATDVKKQQNNKTTQKHLPFFKDAM